MLRNKNYVPSFFCHIPFLAKEVTNSQINAAVDDNNLDIDESLCRENVEKGEFPHQVSKISFQFLMI